MRNIGEKIALSALRQIDPETSHKLALKALNMGLGPNAKIDMPELAVDLAGLKLSNPIGVAAGFDKNGEAIAPLMRAGFGFVEIGAVTPRAQPGNPKPRLFRLKEDAAAINRFGFNNQGMEVVGERLSAKRPDGVLGVNLGANKDSDDRASDYAKVMAHLGSLVDFATINVSSPNTEKLRDLQGVDALRGLISGVLEARSKSAPNTRVFLKIAPDLTEQEIEDICMLALDLKIDALVATNTTLSREGLTSIHKDEMGGLSGKPLRARSTEVIKLAHNILGEKLPIIGVGGIDSAQAAMEKLDAGAKAIQLYTGLVYQGFGLIEEIKSGLINRSTRG